MTFLLDTNIVIEIERQNSKVIREISKMCNKKKPFISSLTVSEFICGSLKQSLSEQIKTLEDLKSYNVVNTTISSSILLANFKHILVKKGKKIPLFDLFIASLAIDNDLTLVTMDSHFKRIPGLDVIHINPQ